MFEQFSRECPEGDEMTMLSLLPPLAMIVSPLVAMMLWAVVSSNSAAEAANADDDLMVANVDDDLDADANLLSAPC